MQEKIKTHLPTSLPCNPNPLSRGNPYYQSGIPPRHLICTCKHIYIIYIHMCTLKTFSVF